MRFRGAIVAALAAVLVMVLALPGEANHSWGKYHWQGTGARTVRLINSVSSPWGTNLNTAASDWDASEYVATPVESGASDSNTRSTCPPVSGKVRVCNYTYGNTNWLGIAEIWTLRGKDGHIAQGRVKLNDTYMNSTPYNTSAYRQYVTCQEVGHTLGLDHQDTNQENANLGTCMDYTHDPDGSINNQLSNEHPNSHDYEQLVLIYSHNDSTRKPGPPGSSSASRRSVQVRQDGAYTVTTFILWA